MRNTGKKLVKKTGEVLSREALDIGPSQFLRHYSGISGLSLNRPASGLLSE